MTGSEAAFWGVAAIIWLIAVGIAVAMIASVAEWILDKWINR